MGDTRVYRYGLLPPTGGQLVVEEQMRLAHRYSNELIATARALWERERDIQRAHSAPLAAAEAALAAAESAVHALRATARGGRQRTRTREIAGAVRAEIAGAVAGCRAAREQVRAARRTLREDPVCQAALAEARDRAGQWRRAARAASGVYWGTYLCVEQAVEAATQAARKLGQPPRFRRWTGDGTVGTEVMHGLAVAAVMGGEDRRLRITTTPEPIPGRHGKPRPRLWVRVGSHPDRTPVWAEWPIILHRPLPDGAHVHWVRVTRRLVAGREVWEAHLTVRLPPGWRVERCGTGTVAVDIGWRAEKGMGMRVGYWEDALGEGAPIYTEARTCASLDKAASIRGYRDTDLDTIRATLIAVRRMPDVPPWWREATATLHAWRSPGRFAALWRRWESARWPGDACWFEALRWWRARDRHLWQYETGMRQTAIRRRDEGYRIVAAQLARQYETLVIERFDLRTFAGRKPAEEGADTEGQSLRAQRVQLAPSMLRQALVQAFRARGGQVIEVPAAQTTIRCAVCGDMDATWDPAANLIHSCGHCGARWDQDANACRNLLRLARERPGDAESAGTARGNESAEMGGSPALPRGRFQRRKLAARERAQNSSLSQGVACPPA